MGLPMSINLAKSGVEVLAFDTNPKACNAATKEGLKIAESCSQIGESSHVLFTMLPSCEAVDAVMNELVEASSSSESKVVVDCSTVNPSTTFKWYRVWRENGHAMLDAPVSGGVKGATDGTLTFMVGCHNEQDLQKVTPYFEIMGKSAIPCGGPGTGTATKLCNNIALAAQMVGICEAMNLGEALCVDPVVLADVMNTSTAKCWSCEVNNPHPLVAEAKKSETNVVSPASQDYEGGFATKLMLKDLGLAVSSAKEARVALPITTTAEQLYRMADLRGFTEKDFGVILRFLRGN